MPYMAADGMVSCDRCGVLLGRWDRGEDRRVPMVVGDEMEGRRRARGEGWYVPLWGEEGRAVAVRHGFKTWHASPVWHCDACRVVGVKKEQVTVMDGDGESVRVLRYVNCGAPTPEP
jgi:hypothetical protein